MPQLSYELSDKLCECGCGQRTNLIAQSIPSKGEVKGEARRFVRGHRLRAGRSDAELREARRESKRESARKWRSEHRERDLASSRQWALENPERRKEILRRYHERHPDRGRASRAKRRARLREAFVEHVEPLAVLERDDGVCGICHKDVDPLDYHVDHIVPLACGGEHSYANSQPAHPDCNRRKRDQWLA